MTRAAHQAAVLPEITAPPTPESLWDLTPDQISEPRLSQALATMAIPGLPPFLEADFAGRHSAAQLICMTLDRLELDHRPVGCLHRAWWAFLPLSDMALADLAHKPTRKTASRTPAGLRKHLTKVIFKAFDLPLHRQERLADVLALKEAEARAGMSRIQPWPWAKAECALRDALRLYLPDRSGL
ncbi:MAG: hypothetical protein ACPGOY_04670 [Rhodospirillaceae bacterium]